MAVSKAELKKIKALGTKKGRLAEKQFTAEGVRLLEEAVRADFPPVKVIFAPSVLSDRGEKLIEVFKKSRVSLTAVSKKEMEQMTDTETSQGILAVFSISDVNPSKLYKPSYRRLLLCDRISDPGNLGTLARSTLAFGFEMMLLTDESVELYNPKVVRASAGALFSLPTAKISGHEIAELKKLSGAVLIAAVSPADSAGAEVSKGLSLLKKGSALILAIGSEAEGLSAEILEMSDVRISISHRAGVESLNAAVAGSILMSKIFESEQV